MEDATGIQEVEAKDTVKHNAQDSPHYKVLSGPKY